MQVERGADADRDAVDAGDDRLFHPGQRHQEIPDLGAAVAAGGDDHEIGEVVAGREGAGHAEEDMDADRRIGVALGKGRRHFRVHGARQGVLLVRTVHADDLDGALALDEDMVCHGLLVPL